VTVPFDWDAEKEVSKYDAAKMDLLERGFTLVRVPPVLPRWIREDDLAGMSPRYAGRHSRADYMERDGRDPSPWNENAVGELEDYDASSE
jgi:acetylornithine deacetylase/succinyl-diaminopimelate desuccinylase-like protein